MWTFWLAKMASRKRFGCIRMPSSWRWRGNRKKDLSERRGGVGMTRNKKWIFGIAAGLLLTAAVRAQAPAPEAAPAPVTGPRHGGGFGPGPFGERMELLGFGGMHGGKVVTGAPFSAVAVAESKQTLADGTVISHKAQSNLFRDAQGRSRREATIPAIGPLAANGAPRSFVMIHDPVAQTGYMLEPDQKIAHKMRPHGKGGSGAEVNWGK